MVNFGSHGSYDWLVADEDLDLLRVCPELVLGRYLAITSVDSGAYTPDEHDIAAGWSSRGNIAYSPKVVCIEDVPSTPDVFYDEWFVFTNPVDLGISQLGENVFEAEQTPAHVNVFVNYGGFAFDRPEMNDLATLFWKQMEWIRPESYFAEGMYLNFASANKTLFARLRQLLQG